MPLPIELAGGIGLLRQRVTQAREDAGLLPTVEASGYGAPGAIALRQIALGGARAEHPQPAIEDAAMVDGWSSRLGRLGRKQRLEPLPWCVGRVSSVHSTREDAKDSRVCKYALELQATG
jgi:hypothetical protein